MNALITDYSQASGQAQAATQPRGGAASRQQFPGSFAAAPQTQQPVSPQLSMPGTYGQQPTTLAGTYSQQQPMTAESMRYLNGFLAAQVGSRVKVEFLVGTNTYLEKSGKLIDVGANFIVLQEAMTDDLLVCDFFNIKFVTIYR